MFSVDRDYFNPSSSTIMHIDLNSCFATIEQQANPLIRGKPVAVAAYTSDNGCIIASSIEAKKIGVKVGMRVKEGKKLYPSLIVLPPDPWKYRFVNRKLLTLFQKYTPKITIKSIDEMALDFDKTPVLQEKNIWSIAKEIKVKIKNQIGDWLTVSVGIAPSRFLAKTASNLHKPDGLDEINYLNFKKIYHWLRVENLCGIKINTMMKLNGGNIFTALDMYQSSAQKLKSLFNSILGYYWYLRLRGVEVDQVEHKRKSFGNSYALNKFSSDKIILAKILCCLVEKMGRRLRRNGYGARGICLCLVYSDFSYYRCGKTYPKIMYASQDLYKEAVKILFTAVKKPVRIISIACFNLEKNCLNQLNLIPQEEKKRSLTQALDSISKRFGELSVFPASTIKIKDKIVDRIAFGNINELEEFSNLYFTSKLLSSVQ